MRDRWPFAALLFLLAAASLPAAAPVAAQVKVTTLARGGKPLQATADIRLSRYADLTEVNLLKVGDILSENDLVTALVPDLFVELTCPKGTLLRFSGGFRAVISAPGEADCAVDYLSGGLDVLTDEPTRVDIGGKTLGTSGTRYAVRLAREGGKPSERVLVFEGQVEVAAPTGSTEVSTGKTLSFNRKVTKPEPKPVTAAEIQRWATLYARFDMAKARAAGVEISDGQAAEAKLTQLHAEVLRNPAAVQPRLELASAQAVNRIGDEALYNLRRSHKIDARKLQAVQPDGLKRGDTVEYKRFNQLLIEAAHPALPSDVELGSWLAAQRFDDVIATLEAQQAKSPLSSRQMLLLAEGYAGKGDAVQAVASSRQALRLFHQDRLLSAEELALCRRLSAGKP